MARKKQRSSGFWKRVKALLVVLVFGTTLASLFFVVFLLPKSGPTVENRGSTEKRITPIASTTRDKGDSQGSTSGAAKSLDYEEKLIPAFDYQLQEVDLALVQSLITEGISLDALKHQEVIQKKGNNGAYHFQSLVLTLDNGLQRKFLNRLKTYFQDWSDGVSLSKSRAQEGTWEVRVNGILTHELLFEPLEPSPPEPGDTQPKMVLIIDDIGESLNQARKIYNILGSRVTLSILPFCTHSRDIARFGEEHQLDVMLHVPMEPEEYPEVDPGPGCLFTAMDKKQILKTFNQNIRQVPGLVGVNNHMGSKFTADPEAMGIFLEAVKKNDLFFIDSLTTPESKGTTLSARLGIPSLSRDIFIDNDQNVSAILFQLKKAEQLAKKCGVAVAIGHPYPETLTALAEWSKQREATVRLIRVSRLVD